VHRKKKDELSEEERILREAKHKQAIVAAERNRVYFFRQMLLYRKHGKCMLVLFLYILISVIM